jgi:outer membrane protein TolC
MTQGMRGTSAPSVAAVAGLCVAAGCASAQMDLSERQTNEILTDLGARVAAEREAARAAVEARPLPPEEPVAVPEVLTLTDALKIAGRQNRDLMQSREGLVLSALTLLDARNSVGPRLSGSVASILRGDERAEEVRSNVGTLAVTDLLPTGATATVKGEASKGWGRGDERDTTGTGAVVARVTQPLLRGAGYEASHEALTDAERQAIYDVRDFELSRQDLALRVQDQFYGLVAQRQVIRNRESRLESLTFLKAQSERLFELGRASELDKLRSASEYLSAENDLVDARQSYDSARDRFKILLGVEGTVRFDVTEDIPEPPKVALDLRRALDVAMISRLDLMTERDTVEDAERRVRLREREMLPDLNVEAIGTKAGADARRWDATLERDTWTLGVSLELPLDRVRERNALRAARIELDRARRSLSLQEDTVILQVRDSLRSLTSAESSLGIQKQIVASEEKNAKIANIRFQNGEIANRDLTDALENLADARDRLVQEKTNVETARLQLLRNLGVLTLDEDGTWRE